MTRILIADDDDAIRAAFAVYLEDCGHAVAEACDGRGAIEALQAGGIDLLLLDLRMPRMDGMEVLKAVAAASPDLPVVVVSAVGAAAEAARALRNGAWDYLVKPVDDLLLLRQTIDRALERRDMRRQLREHQFLLEELVQRRTAELQAAYQSLENKTTALREMLGVAQEQRDELSRELAASVERMVMPLVEQLKASVHPPLQGLVQQLAGEISALSSPASRRFAVRLAGLTATEMQMCRHIRNGLSSKEIAQAESITVDTVETHRRNIRRKLGISNEKVNLTAYLQSLHEELPSA